MRADISLVMTPVTDGSRHTDLGRSGVQMLRLVVTLGSGDSQQIRIVARRPSPELRPLPFGDHLD